MALSKSIDPGPPPADELDSPLIPPSRTAREILLALIRQPAGIIGGTIILAVVVMAVFAPLLAPYSPTATDPSLVLAGPGHGHLLGTDDAGRDVLSRIIYGTRPALLVATLAVLVGGILGIGLGVIAGYTRGIVESVIMRICDVAFAFPLILIGICAVTVLGPGTFPVGLAVGIGVSPMFIRLARAEVLKQTSLDYLTAARGMGGTSRWIVRRHVFPNITTTMVVQLATTMSLAVVMASALDFLGLGTQPPTPSWGNMLQESRQYLSQAPLFAISPGVVLTVFVLAINLFAAALTNALNPRLRTRILRTRSLMGQIRYRRLMNGAEIDILDGQAEAMREE
jgi:peptide/nickel transport system permease protein